MNMANENPKDSKKRILSAIVEPISSFFNDPKRSSSEGSQGHTSKSRRQKLKFFRSTNTSSNQSAPSNVTAPNGMLPNHFSLMMD